MSIGNHQPSSARLLRRTVWLEIVLILATVGSGILEKYLWAQFVLQPILVFLVFVGILSWLLVPFILLGLALVSGLAVWQRLAALSLAIALPFTHFLALFPLIS